MHLFTQYRLQLNAQKYKDKYKRASTSASTSTSTRTKSEHASGRLRYAPATCAALRPPAPARAIRTRAHSLVPRTTRPPAPSRPPPLLPRPLVTGTGCCGRLPLPCAAVVLPCAAAAAVPLPPGCCRRLPTGDLGEGGRESRRCCGWRWRMAAASARGLARCRQLRCRRRFRRQRRR